MIIVLNTMTHNLKQDLSVWKNT